MRTRLTCIAVLTLAASLAFAQPGRPDRTGRPGPWDNDVLVIRVGTDGTPQQLATFERAGVPTIARLKDGRLLAAHQHFPADDEPNFDTVAVHFSDDEGKTWTKPEVIQLGGLPPGMRFPFDPTLVPLPDGRVRLYFTSMKGRTFTDNRPAIYSAISKDGVHYEFEPGARFEIAGRPVIDCAVVLHDGTFHLFAPDNGTGAPEARNERPRDGTGYHATSTDGLKFTRVEDAVIDGRRRWLGAAVSDGDDIRFFGTGDHGLWTAISRDGRDWLRQADSRGIAGADPGAVKLRDGSWLLVVTGPPRRGTPSDRNRPTGQP